MGRSSRRSRSRSRSPRAQRPSRRRSPSRERGGRDPSPDESNRHSNKGSAVRDWDRERERRKREKELRSGTGNSSVVPLVDLTDNPSVIHIDNDDDNDLGHADPQEEERRMRALMGFGAFDSTKNKKVSGNNVGDVHLTTKRKYRQYMNRKGGFNRPLDSIF